MLHIKIFIPRRIQKSLKSCICSFEYYKYIFLKYYYSNCYNENSLVRKMIKKNLHWLVAFMYLPQTKRTVAQTLWWVARLTTEHRFGDGHSAFSARRTIKVEVANTFEHTHSMNKCFHVTPGIIKQVIISEGWKVCVGRERLRERERERERDVL